MVRVNHPPGGATKLLSETKREPKTVRVLKPPGGGSSICFTDDDSTRRPVRNGSRESPQQKSPEAASASSDAAPDFSCESAAAAAVEQTPPPAQSDTNGTTQEVCPSAREPSPVPSSPQGSSADAPPENQTAPCDDESVAPSVVSDDSNDAAPSLNESSSAPHEEASQSTQECRSEVSHSTETSLTVQTIGCKAVVEVSQPRETDSINGHGDAKEKISLSPLTIQDHSQEESSPNSPSPAVKPEETPKDRTSDQKPGGTPVATTPQPRIKDHMRSNIFMSDEDYFPTRSSRMNASVTTDSPANMPAAGQRQRVPPGGFSTKLW